jgi:hypothetical protein
MHPSATELETAGTAFKTVIDAWTMRDRRNPQLLKLVHAELARLRGGH